MRIKLAIAKHRTDELLLDVVRIANCVNPGTIKMYHEIPNDGEWWDISCKCKAKTDNRKKFYCGFWTESNWSYWKRKVREFFRKGE